MQKEVVIQSITEREDSLWWPDREKTKVLVDGVVIGEGYYGGEPEDNTRYRDYRWVEQLLTELAKSLGATVKVETLQVESGE